MASLCAHLTLFLVLSLVTDGVSSVDEPYLDLVQLVFRHGDRSETRPVPKFQENYPATWPQGFGMLSDVGMKQHYKVGQFIRDHYLITDHQLVNSSYRQQEVVVRSTDVDRSLQSVASQLSAIFPPAANTPQPNDALVWSPIPIHTVPKWDDPILRPYNDNTCPRYMELRKKTDHSEIEATPVPEGVCLSISSAVGDQPVASCNVDQLVQDLAHLSGVTNLNFDNLWQVSDALYCRRTMSQPLPPWATDEVIDFLQILNGYQMYGMFAGDKRKLTGGMLIKELLTNVDNRMASPENNTRRLRFYSAHDTTVAMLLMALLEFDFNVEFWNPPPYASMVTLELWRYNDPSKTPEIRLGYQNSTDILNQSTVLKFTELTMKGCDFSCPLDTFKSLVKDVIPSDWKKECEATGSNSRGKPTTLGANVAVIVVAIALVLGILVLAIVLMGRYLQSRRKQNYFVNTSSNSDMFSLNDE